jgi:hypothetical protein
VIFADGWRTLSSIFSFVALFFACGFATRTDVSPTVAPAETRTPKLALAGLLVTMSLWIVIPGLAHRVDPVGARAFNTLTANTGQRVVLGSRHMAGFIVVPDDLPLPTDVPAMRRSEFAKAFEYSGNGSYQTLTLPSPSTAFAFVAAPNANGTRGYVFIAPPEVLTHREVPAWRFSVEEPIDERRTYWLPVSAATPVAASPR